MSTALSLKELVETLECVRQGWAAYVNIDTGETFMVTDHEEMSQDPEDEDLPDWERESIRKFREIEESDRWLLLPDTWDIHEWRVLQDFALEQSNEEIRSALLRAIHGRGAFQRFFDTVARSNLKAQWYAFRDEAYGEFLRGWLEEHEMQYTDDLPKRMP